MKWLSYIMLLTIFSELTVFDCHTHILNQQEAEVQETCCHIVNHEEGTPIQNNQGDHDENHHCSPFCSSDCCGHYVDIAQIIELENTTIKDIITPYTLYFENYDFQNNYKLIRPPISVIV